MLLKPLHHSGCKCAFPLELGSILLVEADPELRSSRRMVMNSLEHPVLAVGGYQDVSSLPSDGNCCLVAIDLRPSEHEARRIARHVRNTWPGAKILLIGEPSRGFDVPLYDEAVRVRWSPHAVVEAARRLLESNSASR
jgi:hypothetical protein